MYKIEKFIRRPNLVWMILFLVTIYFFITFVGDLYISSPFQVQFPTATSISLLAVHKWFSNDATFLDNVRTYTQRRTSIIARTIGSPASQWAETYFELHVEREFWVSGPRRATAIIRSKTLSCKVLQLLDCITRHDQTFFSDMEIGLHRKI